MVTVDAKILYWLLIVLIAKENRKERGLASIGLQLDRGEKSWAGVRAGICGVYATFTPHKVMSGSISPPMNFF